MNLTGNRHSYYAHLNVIVGPYSWFGLAFLAPNTSQKVTESPVICITYGVNINKFRSDALLTMAKAHFKAENFPQTGSRSKTFTSEKSDQALDGGFFHNTPLRGYMTGGAIKALTCSISWSMLQEALTCMYRVV